MKTLLSLLILILLISSCVKQLDCQAKPHPKIDIDETSVNIEPGASVSCDF